MLEGLDPASVAARILAMFDGLALQRALSQSDMDSGAVFETFVRTLTPDGARS